MSATPALQDGAFLCRFRWVRVTLTRIASLKDKNDNDRCSDGSACAQSAYLQWLLNAHVHVILNFSATENPSRQNLPTTKPPSLCHISVIYCRFISSGGLIMLC